MSPFLASARTFNTLASLLAKLYYKNVLSSSKASDEMFCTEKKQLIGRKKKSKGAEGHCTKRETSVIFPEREGFSFGTS